MNAEISRLRNENAKYEDEQKEDKMKIAELKRKVKELELRNSVVNEKEFENWNWKQIVVWIMSLERGRFGKYIKALNEVMRNKEIEGVDLYNVKVYILEAWRITDRKDREILNEHIQRLVEQFGQHDKIGFTAGGEVDID